jgi:heme/copper-type cytochrome/quinol oxidase subunit 1
VKLNSFNEEVIDTTKMDKDVIKESLFNWSTFMAVILIMMGMIYLCFGCTTSVTTITTRGTASDVVDQEQTAQPDISPTLSVPVKPAG